MDISVSETLQHLLALTESTSAGEQREEGIKKQQNSGEEAVEMAKTLCELSTGNESSNQEFDGVKMETVEKRENVQSSYYGGLEQPVSIQVQLSPLKTISFLPSPTAEKIYKDANFSSFAQFKRAFEEWKHIFHHPFRVASSEKHEDIQLAERFKYRYVVYHCSRYGEPRKRGAGRRPHQNYLPCGCNAKLRLNFHAQNEGSLCVTTLFAEHNHEPISEDMFGGSGMKRIKNSPENEFGEQEHSPNSTASSIAAAATGPSFSPLSLQPALHHSPSSGGQSSSEGANNGALETQSILDSLISPENHQKLIGHFQQQNSQHCFPLMSPLAKKSKPMTMTTSHHQGSVQVADHKSPTILNAIPSVRTNQPSTHAFSNFLETTRQQGQMNDQQQQLLLPLMIQGLLRSQGSAQNGTPIRPNQVPQLSGLLSTQARQQSTSSTQRQKSNVENGTPTSSMLSAALNHHLQQIPPTCSAAPQTANPSALAFLQLQMLINSANKQSQSQHQTPNQAINPNPQLIQQLLLSGNNFSQQMQQKTVPNQPKMAMFTGRVSHPQESTTLNNRQEIVQEADLLLQMLVGQMLRCRDLGAYLRRLRQFLAENCD